MNTAISRRTFVAATCAAALSPALAADAYPAGTVKIVIPAPPGGTADKVARTLGAKVAAALGQPVIMDYKPGASGVVAEESVVRSVPDGLTLLMDHSVLAMNPVLQKSVLRFDPLKDLRPVICLVRYQHMLIVPGTSTARSVQDLVEFGKANPGRVNYATAGSGSPQHVMAELFLRAHGIPGTHIPYKGGAQQLAAVAGGEVNFSFVAVPTGLELARSGRVRALAVLDDARTRALPDVPSFGELNQRGMTSPWLGIFVPRATPEPIVQRLHQEFLKALKDPQIVDWIAAESLQFIGSTPAAFAQAIAEEVAFNEKLVKELNLKAD